MLGETMQDNRPMALDKNSKFIYQGGADCQRLWRRHGWVPPTEYRTDYEFGKNRELDQRAKGEKWMKI